MRAAAVHYVTLSVTDAEASASTTPGGLDQLGLACADEADVRAWAAPPQ